MIEYQTLLLRVRAKDLVAAGVLELTLVPADAAEELPTWQPGAHVDLHAGNGEIRQYSLCGDPVDRSQWRVAILRVPDGRGGSAWFHDELEAGDELKAVGPRNNFALEAAEEYVFVAGGIGITPLLPMVRFVSRGDVPWRLVYGGRSRSSMAFVDDLLGLGESVQIVPENESGLIDLTDVLGSPVPGRRVYCCGPEPLLNAVESAMAGRNGETLHVERFRPVVDLDATDDAFEVVLASSGRSVDVAPGQSIIDALAGVGVEVQFSCREGTCGTCETRVLSGVPDHRDSVLSAEERATNDCMMICVGQCSAGPLVLDL